MEGTIFGTVGSESAPTFGCRAEICDGEDTGGTEATNGLNFAISVESSGLLNPGTIRRLKVWDLIGVITDFVALIGGEKTGGVEVDVTLEGVAVDDDTSTGGREFAGNDVSRVRRFPMVESSLLVLGLALGGSNDIMGVGRVAVLAFNSLVRALRGLEGLLKPSFFDSDFPFSVPWSGLLVPLSGLYSPRSLLRLLDRASRTDDFSFSFPREGVDNLLPSLAVILSGFCFLGGSEL